MLKGQIAVVLAPILNTLAVLTVEVPGLDVVTASLAAADDLIAETAPEVAAFGTAVKATGDGLQGHWGDVGMDAAMLAASRMGGKGKGAEEGGPPGSMAAQDDEAASAGPRSLARPKTDTAPKDSNAYNGPTYRIQRGARYQDQDGNFYHKNVHNDKSPFFDEEAANKTHIPWPGDYQLPWKK